MSRLADLLKSRRSRDLKTKTVTWSLRVYVLDPCCGESRQADAHEVNIDSFLFFSRGQFVGAVLTMLNSCYWS